jgi:replication-associated recombination protein RarA
MIDMSNFEQKSIPKSLKDTCFESSSARTHMAQITSGKHGFPSDSKCGIILHGPVGAGKTTLAHLIPDLMEGTSIGLDCPWRPEYNIAKGNNGVEFLNKLNEFCYTSNINGKYTYVILNEVNNLSHDAMSQLKGIMDNHKKRVVFIMTTNEFYKLEAGVIDRSYCFGFYNVPVCEWVDAMERVLGDYGIGAFSRQQLENIAKDFRGSGRNFASEMKRLIAGYYEKCPREYAAYIANQTLQNASLTHPPMLALPAPQQTTAQV